MQRKQYLTLAVMLGLAVALYLVHPALGGAALGLAVFYVWDKGL